jgi:hypothetical protein
LRQGFLDHDDGLVWAWGDVRGQTQRRHSVIIDSDSGLNGNHAREIPNRFERHQTSSTSLSSSIVTIGNGKGFRKVATL